jgi:hypothetical protein
MAALDATVPGSSVRWQLTGTVGAHALDVQFTVPAAYQWQEHVDALKLVDPCSGQVTLMVTSDGTPGKLYGRPAMVCYGPQAKAAKDALRQAFEAVGPWTLATPTETLTVCADPSAQDFESVNAGDTWTTAFTWQQVA